MLIEIWEQLRGYNKWARAVATVESAELSRVGEIGSDKAKPQVALGWESVCKIKWKDQNQVEPPFRESTRSLCHRRSLTF